MPAIHAATEYLPIGDMCVLTAYFNPCRYRTLLNNYLEFSSSIRRSGLQLITVECAFEGAPFELPKSDSTIQVRSDSVLWQKERLLNIGLAAVRSQFSKIAWLDADIFFVNSDWAVEASGMLERNSMVQLFDRVFTLPKNATAYDGIGSEYESFASVVCRDETALASGTFERHGHTGYAWAGRVDCLERGFFDGYVLAHSDHLMAHAMVGDLQAPCIEKIFQHDRKNREYFQNWASAFHTSINGNIGFVPGTLLHHWHGEQHNRRYQQHAVKLASFGVDPQVDLRINSDGCWEWNTDRYALHDYIASYFSLRRDDYDY